MQNRQRNLTASTSSLCLRPLTLLSLLVMRQRFLLVIRATLESLWNSDRLLMLSICFFSLFALHNLFTLAFALVAVYIKNLNHENHKCLYSYTAVDEEYVA
jgi:hypothetical protein